ncbi:uncharacterized protein LOC108682277 [Hyalella azteca]|uniref:Uncharacterized protein LOC108682277 n=1 Tax=Hyalella azteca TaxID=294128 RepID=A0A8B7PNA3_HYAAZ|nr:uncharacterized protein LOC108682277 [Hyalella azteca]
MPAGVVALFGLVTNLFLPFSTLQEGGALSPVACAARCSQHDLCGGFYFNSSLCLLVVISAPGTKTQAASTSPVFRLNSYRDRYLLHEYPHQEGVSPTVALNTCQNNGMELVPYPASLKDRAILSIRQSAAIFLDMIRTSNGSYVTRSSGVLVPDTVIYGWGNNEPTYGNQMCISLGASTSLFYDHPCNTAYTWGGVMCVYTVLP